tara:strand:+ start:965 stop:3709 length:2745 start_codon:yes stop_codon:yes gene_type:complete
MDLLELALSQRKESTDIKKKVLNKSNDDDNSENTLQAQFKGAVKTQQIKNLSDSTFGKLSPSEIISARMTEVSYINYRDGAHAASAYVKKYLPDYRWDKALTTEHLATFINKETGKVRVGLRGTQNLEDWKTNARILTSTMGQSTQIKDIDKSILEIFNKYGKDNVEILSGHSKGAGTAFYFGEKYSIDTHLQDPPISTNELFGGKTKAKHMIAKTPGDLVSAASNVAVFRKGISITDLKQRGEGFKGAHHLGVMTGTDYKKLGSKVFDPKLKNQAFIINELKKGKTAEEIVKDVGYSSKESRKILRDEIANAIATPETHESILKESGFLKSEPTTVVGIVKKKITDKVVPKVDVVLGKTLNKVAKITSAGGIAGILSSVGTSQALNALGSDNAIVNEGVIGAVSNATQDAAASAFRHMRSQGHHVPINNAVSSLPEGEVERLLAQSTTTSTVARTAEQVSTAGRIASIGTRALASLTKGGVAGLLGVGVQMGAQTALVAMGLDEHTANIVSRLAGAAASGMIFGPVAVGLFTAIEGAIIAFEEIWNFFNPENERSELQKLADLRDERSEAILAHNNELIRLRDEDYINRFGMTFDEKNQEDDRLYMESWDARAQATGTGAVEWIWENLKMFPEVMSANTPREANDAIYEIFRRIADENPTQSGREYEGHGWTRDFIDVIDPDSRDVPQFDDKGNLIIKRFSEAGGTFPADPNSPNQLGAFNSNLTKTWGEIQIIPERQQDDILDIIEPIKSFENMTEAEQDEFIQQQIVNKRTTQSDNFEDELNEEFQEESSLIDEDEDNYEDENEVVEEVEEVVSIDPLTTPHVYSTRQSILNTINNNSKVKELLFAGDRHGANKAIREIFIENKNRSEYSGSIEYGDPAMPQLLPSGGIIYQSYDTPTPTTEKAVKKQNNI